MDFGQFQRELSGNVIKPVYVFAGEEEFLAAEGAEAVIAAALPGPERRFCLVELDGAATPDELRRALFTPSFFGARQVVRLRDPAKLSPETLEFLAANLGKIPPTAHLLLLGQPDKRRQAAKQLLAAAAVVDCAPCKKGEAAAWAVARAKALGLKLGPESARFLVETVGTGLRTIAAELEKVQTYLGGEKKEITPADLAPLLGREREDNVFQLVEACAAGRSAEALRILTDLLVLGEPEPLLLSLLARQTRQILMAGDILRHGGRAPEIAKQLGVPPFVADKLIAQARRLGFQRCREILRRILLADFRSKTGEREPRVELELVVLEMAGGLNAASR